MYEIEGPLTSSAVPENKVLKGEVLVEAFDGVWVSPEEREAKLRELFASKMGWFSEIIYQAGWSDHIEHTIWDILSGDKSAIESWKEWADMSIYSNNPLEEGAQLLEDIDKISKELGEWMTFEGSIPLEDWIEQHEKFPCIIHK